MSLVHFVLLPKCNRNAVLPHAWPLYFMQTKLYNLEIALQTNAVNLSIPLCKSIFTACTEHVFIPDQLFEKVSSNLPVSNFSLKVLCHKGSIVRLYSNNPEMYQVYLSHLPYYFIYLLENDWDYTHIYCVCLCVCVKSIIKTNAN